MDYSWILLFRTDTLTSFFKMCPIFASQYFYIAVIATGYWHNPRTSLYRSLMLLIPLSTVINCLLKNFFQIPRPDISLHLLPVLDSFGFPSGDVQVAVVFWGMMYLCYQGIYLRCLSVMMVIVIAVSRVYLGVHSVLDVTAAVVIGLAIVYAWTLYFSPMFEYDSNKNPCMNLSILVLTVLLLHVAVSFQFHFPSMMSMSTGSLLGFMVAYPYVRSCIAKRSYRMPKTLIAPSLLAVVAFISYIPIFKSSAELYYISTMFVFFTLALFMILLPIYVGAQEDR